MHRVFTRAGAVRLVARTSRTDGRRRVVRERRVLQQNALFSRAKPSRVYYDTARSGGVGGKANTCPRNQTGHWRGYNLLAGKKGSKRGLRPGEEIFVPYGREYNLHVGGNGIDDARQGWGFTRRRRQSGGGRREEEQTAVLVPTPQPGATPAPLRGGEGGNLLYRGVRAFQHALGVSAPT